jgi:glycosyltransferase involved in cell wall biosynthesis
MSPPLVSVLITTYNYGRFIEEAIESALSQDFPSDQMEVLVVDDGSTDDTAERVRKYASKVRYFYQPNGGQASALNLGFVKARGEIIALLDGDDFFFPGKLARVVEAFEQDPALGMVYHPMQGWNMQTNECRESHYPLVSGSPLENLERFLWYFGPGTCVSYRRRSLDRLLPIPEHIRMLADDYPGSLVVFVAPILALPECLSAYRVHGKNSFQNDETQMPMETRKNRLRLWQTVIDAKRKWLAENGFTRKQPAVRCLLDCWTLFQQKERFLIKPPGRLRYFWFVVLENYVASPIQTWKLTVFNYLFGPIALLLGYKKAQQMYQWRLRTMETIQRWIRMVLRTRAEHG